MVGIGKGAEAHILIKDAVALEQMRKVDTVVLDKTGTVTEGRPTVTGWLHDAGWVNEHKGILYAAELKSEHPLALAIVEELKKDGNKPAIIDSFESRTGRGIVVTRGGKTYWAGSHRLLNDFGAKVSDLLKSMVEEYERSGKSLVYFGEESTLLAVIVISDKVKPTSIQAVKQMQAEGKYVVLLTGDGHLTAQNVAGEINANRFIAEALPDDKENVIKELQREGRVVAMVGDGINDAPALTRADIGIAIGAGTDIAIDAADVVLMKSRLSDVPAAVRLSRATLKNIHENLFWAFFYNVIGIPLAAGVWIPIFGWTLNPMFGAAAMSLSSFCVVTNALRLNLFKIHDTKKDKKIKQATSIEVKNDYNKKEKEQKTMVKVTVNVEGMMCGHCEAHVNEAIKKAFGVEDVVSSHENNTTVFTAPEKVDEDKIRQTIKDAGYEVTGITQE